MNRTFAGQGIGGSSGRFELANAEAAVSSNLYSAEAPALSASAPHHSGPGIADASTASEAAARMSAEQATEFEEMLVHRVLQRVDVALDHRLRRAIATVVEEHSLSLLPKLRDEVEGVVRRAVNEAVADELASQSKTGSRGGFH